MLGSFLFDGISRGDNRAVLQLLGGILFDVIKKLDYLADGVDTDACHECGCAENEPSHQTCRSFNASR